MSWWESVAMSRHLQSGAAPAYQSDYVYLRSPAHAQSHEGVLKASNEVFTAYDALQRQWAEAEDKGP